MRVCDRHHRTQATGRLVLERDDQYFDLCDECLIEIQKFISSSDASVKLPKRNSEKSG